MERKLAPTVGVGVRASILGMVRHVTKNKLRGQYLRRRTGTLIRSITASPRFLVREDLVRGAFGSNLDYARAHEEGFSGRVTVRAHLRTMADQGGSFFSGLGGVHVTRVREHARMMDIPGRHFLRDTVVERTPDAGLNVRKAVLVLADTRKVPTLTQVRNRSVSLRELRAF